MTSEPTPPPSAPPAGWYPDPGGSPALRWWDATQWTDHFAYAPPFPSGAAGPLVATQAGNVVLAGWGPRFAGYLLDGFLLYTPIVIVELIIGIGSALASLGNSSPSGLSAAAWAVICLINLAPIAYWFLFLRYRGQTLGMMVAGVRAIDRTTGHGLGTAQTWRRVLVFFCLVPLWGLVGFIVLAASQNGIGGGWVALFQVGAYAGALSTGLWPLRSPANQTLQDKAADTIVIRANSGSVPPVGSS